MKYILAVLGALIVASACYGLNASSSNITQVGSGSGNVSVVTQGANSSFSQSASQQAIYSADAYISSRLGDAYAAAYVSYLGGESYGNKTYTYFAYHIPFSNDTSVTGTLPGQAPVVRLLGITVILAGTTVIGYAGPAGPYTIRIPPSEAYSLANNYGITNGTIDLVWVFNATQNMSNSAYGIAWAVRDKSPLKSGVYQGIYIDAISGNVVGEFLYNPAIVSTKGPASYGKSGDFSLFYMQGGSQSSQSSTDSQYILPLLIIAFVLLGAGLYFSRK